MIGEARHFHVGGVVQGVGFRPFVFRLARTHGITGWVLNGETGVEIHAEGAAQNLERFARAVIDEAPPAASIAAFDVAAAAWEGFGEFAIRASTKSERKTVRVSPDLPVCADCARELFDPNDRRIGYPYINCTNCGPRYSIIRALPYDRPNTTMASWPLCPQCDREYHDPGNRRFHAQPVACSRCGPAYDLVTNDRTLRGNDAIDGTVALLRAGAIVGIKGIGGYHLACDARQPAAVQALRERKYRKERPFALMVRTLDDARAIADLTPEAEALLCSVARPIVLAPARAALAGVAPDNRELGIMLPYTPLQLLLFARGAPEILVMTSANRSSEPIAYDDADARRRLDGIVDALLVGEREIARRVDDSVARATALGPVVLRHARGYAPRAAASLPTRRPMVCVGADLKSAVAIVVDGTVFASQHIGDLDQAAVHDAFRSTIRDLCTMYDMPVDDLLVVHDAHPEYASTSYARTLPGEHVAVQHHRAHVASVLGERGAFDARVTGIAFDGTGYGDDGSIWGGEFFVGSVREGFTRALSLRPALLPGGDAAARFPVQAAAGFLTALDDLPAMGAAPFAFPSRYRAANELVDRRIRTFVTTSVGRLFDTVAALLGFTRESTFEGQAAMWVEHLAWQGAQRSRYRMPLVDETLDYRPLLRAVIEDRLAGREPNDIAYAFHEALADGVVGAIDALGERNVVASGGVFQNALLLALLAERLGDRLWINQRVPPNDGGICVGQATLAAFR